MLTLGGVVSNNASDNAEDNAGPWWNETRGWSSSDKTGNGTRAPADHGPLASKTVIEQHPGHGREDAGKVGVPRSHDSTEISTEGRTTVETEPAEPQEHSAEHDERNIVWAEVQHHLLLASAKNHGVCESRATGDDFDRSSTGVVEDTPRESPAVDIPDPARDWAVDNRCPAEEEDHHWDQATALGDGTSQDSGSNGAELHLLHSSQLAWL